MEIRRFIAVLVGVIALAIASIYCIYNQEFVWAVVFGLFCLEAIGKLPDNDNYSNEEVEEFNRKADAHNKRVDERNARIRENNNSE